MTYLGSFHFAVRATVSSNSAMPASALPICCSSYPAIHASFTGADSGVMPAAFSFVTTSTNSA